MGDNPYDLKTRKPAGPKAKIKGKEWTPEEQKEKLRDYIEVPRSEWEKVKYGTHMRYYTKDGLYRSGGFVLANPTTFKPRGQAKEMTAFRLQNNYNKSAPGHTAWLVTYDQTARIYVKMDAGTIALRNLFEENLRNTTEKLNKNIRTVAEYAAGLEKKIQLLEAQIQKRH